ncbi:hypothetical protein [Caulobacter sp. DWR2-3-1b2]|uniref:hypothetical protein n=1 Tax=unclassified Caulobacter TaxID=2648921 RepID=UPI003CF6F143
MRALARILTVVAVLAAGGSASAADLASGADAFISGAAACEATFAAFPDGLRPTPFTEQARDQFEKAGFSKSKAGKKNPEIARALSGSVLSQTFEATEAKVYGSSFLTVQGGARAFCRVTAYDAPGIEQKLLDHLGDGASGWKLDMRPSAGNEVWMYSRSVGPGSDINIRIFKRDLTEGDAAPVTIAIMSYG